MEGDGGAVSGKTILVAGATGYLGSRVVQALSQRGATVRALVRPGKAAASAEEHFEAEVTKPASLRGACDGVDWVFSALGITRQRDGVTYHDVDYGGNAALLAEAERAGVSRFGVISVVNLGLLQGNAMVDAKARFLSELEGSKLAPRVLAATGFFSDMGDLFCMAQRGAVYLFGDGMTRSNPVDGEDVAEAAVDSLLGEERYLEVGGPDVLTWNAVAELAFEALGRKPRVRHIPLGLARAVLPPLRLFSRNAPVALDFFMRASASDMVAPTRGQRRLQAHFQKLAAGGVA